MERKIGEVFTYEGKTYQVIKGSTYKDNQPMIKKFNQKRRVYFDLEGNVYKDKQQGMVQSI